MENIKKAGLLIFAVGTMALALQQMFCAGLSQKVLKAKNTTAGCAMQADTPFIIPAVGFPLFCILSLNNNMLPGKLPNVNYWFNGK